MRTPYAHLIRTYATFLPSPAPKAPIGNRSARTSPRPSRTSTAPSSLQHFLLRQRVINLYRSIMRATNQIPKTSSTRQEMKTFAREEFERNRHVSDMVQIRYLVSTGRTELEKMMGYVFK